MQHERDVMYDDLIALEAEAIRLILEGEDETLRILRSQRSQSKIKEVIRSPAGFYIDYLVPEECERTAKQSFDISDVKADAPSLSAGIGLVLFIRNGRIETLEGFTYDEVLESKIDDFSVGYLHGPVRDLAALRLSVEPEKGSSDLL